MLIMEVLASRRFQAKPSVSVAPAQQASVDRLLGNVPTLSRRLTHTRLTTTRVKVVLTGTLQLHYIDLPKKATSE